MSKLKSEYRDDHKLVQGRFHGPQIGEEGKVVFWSISNGNRKDYRFEITADDLLITAQRCLQQLDDIAGVHYKIVFEKK